MSHREVPTVGVHQHERLVLHGLALVVDVRQGVGQTQLQGELLPVQLEVLRSKFLRLVVGLDVWILVFLGLFDEVLGAGCMFRLTLFSWMALTT